MNPDTYFRYVDEVSSLVEKNRPMWTRMQRDGVASWRYLKLLSQGHYKSPSVEKLAAIKAYIKANKQAAA